ncbi:MAG TPA: ligase-associated DNA damage response DEXH box helicase [Phnomibacter sp.]|nr:ligase-associated DNA damage response DEXH box helicase [Phnomibacter sp.]
MPKKNPAKQPSSPATGGKAVVEAWLVQKGMQAFDFQQETWEYMRHGQSGIVNAPTGCGKTFSVFLGNFIQYIDAHPGEWPSKKNNGLQLLWITPLRALGKDLARAMQEVVNELGLPWQVGIRNGDTPQAERARQKLRMPEVLIITPESLHLLLATKEHRPLFASLRTIAVDEWHELMGSKRGVQVELAISYLLQLAEENKNRPQPLQLWGISATIGNLDQAKEVLLHPLATQGVIVKSQLQKKNAVHSIIPEEIETYPWAGHMGIKLIEQVIPIIERSNTTLIFINTRGMAERWYQALLDVAPQLSGAIALHHGSIEQELRLWVEEALHQQKLKAVVATASLDLGVDFRPVDTVIQVGSPKGVSRFLQRAGRAGHQPGEISHVYFLPTHSLELLEAAALKTAIEQQEMESKEPLLLCFDVLCQFLCTLAVGDGFTQQMIRPVVERCWCFQHMTSQDWQQVMLHITKGGKALDQYDEYKKVEEVNGLYRITNRRLALRHRLHIGTIVSDAMLKVKLVSGGYIGHIEEYFISRLQPGDVFTLAGRNVELVQIKDMTVLVRKSNQKKSQVPSWNGGRMSLSANLGKVLRHEMHKVATQEQHAQPSPEIAALTPLFQLQASISHIPNNNELLIEHHQSKEGYHLLVYPFEGRQVHEAMSAILAYRISRLVPISFSIAMNDYGFELLSDQPIPVDDTNAYELFSTEDLFVAMQHSTNLVEMSTRKFRDIAVIGGLVFQGMPGEQKKARHLQSSASLLFRVFKEFDADNILLRQAFQEVYEQQMEERRLRQAFQRIESNSIVIKWPEKLTPLSFPIIADGLNRNNLSSEKLEDRIKKMAAALNGRS